MGRAKLLSTIIIFRRWISKRNIASTLGFLLTILALIYSPVLAGNPSSPDASLRIEPQSAYNLVVDSNVLTPASYGPKAATLMAKFCNDGSTDLTEVVAYIGNYNSGVSSTPGVYPARSTSDAGWDSLHPDLTTAQGGSGSYSLRHEGGSSGTADATRYIGTIPAGECKIQYWIVSYPTKSINGNRSVAGAVGPQDDLFLNYDFWAAAKKGASTLTADTRRIVFFRNEISASANKIWPNTTSKVPEAYLNVIAATLGWDTLEPGGGNGAPGTFFRTQGIWYDLGNVGAGFDNNGDLVPDRNAWMQPVGDPTAFDAGCFRLVRTYGILVIKRSSGDMLVPFEDQLYFTNMPGDNTGVVGLVYYEYISLDGVCTGTLTPYQEVASGYDNEKFNGDYGFSIPPLVSTAPEVVMNKTVDKASVSSLPDTLTYSIPFTNTGPVSAGQAAYNMPLVVHDTIPAGTQYIAGSAASSNVLPIGVTAYDILFSIDNGTSWTQTQPSPASSVTDIQWWLSDALPAGANGIVRFQVAAPGTIQAATIDNTAHLQFGSGNAFATDSATTLLPGLNSISGFVFEDNGAGSFLANRTKDTGEAGVQSVRVTLYLDTNGDGLGEIQIAQQDSVAGGGFSFISLPDGKYVVAVDSVDSDLITTRVGWTNTTDLRLAVDLDSTHISGIGVSASDQNFGFAPVLTLTKSLLTGSPNEANDVQYRLAVKNNLPGGGAGGACIYTTYGSAIDTANTGTSNSNSWTDYANLVSSAAIDNTFALARYSNATDYAAVTSYALGSYAGTIQKVEVLLPMQVVGSLGTNDNLEVISIIGGAADATITSFIGNTLTTGLKAVDITHHRAWTWADLNGTNLSIQLQAKHTGGQTGDLEVDAIGIRVQSSMNNCESDTTVLSTVPLTDTFNADVYDFVNSSPVKSKLTIGANVHGYTSAGLIRWDNVGPLSAGATAYITVTLHAKTFTNARITTTNYGDVAKAYFANGVPANNASANAGTTTLNGLGSLSGYLFSNIAPLTWNAWSGYGGTDYFIPNVTLNLYACQSGGSNTYPGTTNRVCSAPQNNSGTWNLVGTTNTGPNGAYRFDGLRSGYYYVEVASGGLPNGYSENLEANVTANGNGGGTISNATGGPFIWASDDTPSDNLLNTYNPVGTIGTSAENITQVNFGFSTNPLIYGTVWQDMDGTGSRDSGDNGILAGNLVQLINCGAGCGDAGDTVLTTHATDTNGYYFFDGSTAGLTAGTNIYKITVLTGALPNAGTTVWSETAENDGSIDNNITLSLTTGEIDGPHDFGFHHTSTLSIGDKLYYDWNQNGRQDSNEVEGLPDITITLHEDVDGDGVIDIGIDAQITTTSSGPDGAYLFGSLPDGAYFVVVDEADPQFPVGAFQTGDPDETGICIVCNGRGRATLTTQDMLTIDFGYHPQGTGNVGDTVWKDVNSDAVQSGVQEVGLPNVTVWLEGDLNGDGFWTRGMTDTTDINGSYYFDGLPPGNYRTVVDTEDADLPADPYGSPFVASTPTSISHVLADGETWLNGDFGFRALSSIGDTVYWDADGNGSQDASEPGISGVQVSLTNTSPITLTDGTNVGVGGYIRTTNTNTSGVYFFSGLVSGSYDVSVGAITGNPDQTADPDRDGENCLSATFPALPACDDQTNVTLVAATSFTGADFGYQSTGVVGDRVWLDFDGDGSQDAGEPGVGAVKVTLTADQNVTINGTPYTTGTPIDIYTDPDGYWSFSRVNASSGTATFTVTITPPAIYTITSDPDAVENGVTTFVIDTLGSVSQVGGSGSGCPGTCYMGVDFGLRISGNNALSGTVCLDDPARDGFCGITTTTAAGVKSGETAIFGQVVYLYLLVTDNGTLNQIDPGDVARLVSMTTTDADGNYNFGGVPDGMVVIAVGAPIEKAILTTNSYGPGNDLPDTANLVISNDASGITSGAYQAFQVSGGQTKYYGDFAFVTDTSYDLGDLPNNRYSITSVNFGGAKHIIPGSGQIYLGSAPSTETDTSGNSNATADSDEGIRLVAGNTWTPNALRTNALEIDITGSGWLIGWMDFNNDDDFNDSGEMIINQAVSSGTNQSFDVMVPIGAFCSAGNPTCSPNKDNFARFRLFTSQPAFPSTAYSGAVTNGEVEDYLFSFSPTVVKLKGISAHSTPSPVSNMLAILALILVVLTAWRLFRS